jgi:hypothetical protein
MPQLFSQTNDYSNDSIISASKRANRIALDNMSKQSVIEEQLQNSDAITGDGPKFINEFLNIFKLINANITNINDDLTKDAQKMYEGAGVQPRITKKFTRRLEPPSIANAYNKKYGTILLGGKVDSDSDEEDTDEESSDGEVSTLTPDSTKKTKKSKLNQNHFFKIATLLIKQISDANIMFNKYIAGDLASLTSKNIDKIKKLNTNFKKEINMLDDNKLLFNLTNTVIINDNDPVLYEYLMDGAVDLYEDIKLAIDRFQKFNYVLTPSSDAPEQLVGAGRGNNEYKLNFMTLGDSNSFRNTHPLKFKL